MSMLLDNLFLANRGMIFWPDEGIGQVIVLIILALLLFSVYVFQEHWSRYRREIAGVNTVSLRIDQWLNELNQSMNEDDEDTRDKLMGEEDDIVYQPTVDISMLLQGLNGKLIISDRLVTLEKLKKARVKVNIDVLQKLSLAAEGKEWTLKVPGYVMTLAMLLGVFGTFYGLSGMVGSIGAQLSSLSNAGIDQFTDILGDMQQVLGGAATAFATTLAGLTCTIVVSFFNFRLSQRQAAFYDHLESFTAEKLLPYAFPNLEEGDVLDQISDRLKDSFEELNDTIDKNNDAIENLNGLYQRFDEIIEQVQSITTSESSTQMKGVIHEMNGVNESLKNIISKYKNEQILLEIQELEKTNQKFVQSYNNILLDASWIPKTRVFLLAITILLFLMTTVLGYNAFVN